jgi:hypothetical protein
MNTHDRLRKTLNIPADEKVENIEMPFKDLVILLDMFHKHELTKDICPKCRFSPMIRIDDKYICEMCE